MENRYFPVFLPTQGKKTVVFGGGNVATRRVKTLCNFNFDIVVIAKDFSQELLYLQEKDWIKCKKHELLENDKEYIREVLKDAFMALACTDNRQLNRLIGITAKEKSIFVSVADARQEGNFFFPGIATGKTITAGIIGDGTDHKETAKASQKIREILQEKDF